MLDRSAEVNAQFQSLSQYINNLHTGIRRMRESSMGVRPNRIHSNANKDKRISMDAEQCQ
jgi:hypothetical protein